MKSNIIAAIFVVLGKNGFADPPVRKRALAGKSVVGCQIISRCKRSGALFVVHMEYDLTGTISGA